MDDPNQIIQAQKTLEEQLNKSAGAAEKLRQKLHDIKLDSLFQAFSTGFKQLNADLTLAGSNALNTSKSFQQFANVATSALTLIGNFKGFDRFAISGGSAVNSMSGQFEELVGKLGSVEAAAKAVGGRMGSALIDAGEKGARKLLQQIEQAEKLENAYFSLAGAQGTLGKVFQQAGDNLENLQNLTAQFSTRLLESAKITGFSTAEVVDFVSKTKDIPGVMDQVIEGTGGATNRLDAFTTVLQLSRGTGREVSEVLDVMKKAYENLGNAQGRVEDSSAKGVKMFSLMAETSKSLGLRFSDTEQLLGHVADTFKLIGDNTEASTRILGRFSNALQSTGLTAKQSVDVIGSMIDAVKDLDMGTKALISQRSGGPGGLQGAFRVENLMRQGKVDEVVKMMEQNLRRQFGGRIYTQEEAAQSPQAAAQFMRQRAILKSGAFGSLAKTDESATRLLEAMAKGPVETGNVIKGSMDALKDTVGRGTQMSERQLTALNDLNISLDRGVVIQQQQLMLMARNTLGTTGGSEYARELIQSLENTQEKMVGRLALGEAQGFETTKNEETAGSIAGIARTFSVRDQVGKQLIEIGGDAVKGVSGFVANLFDNIEEETQKASVQKEQAKTIAATQRIQAPDRSAMYTVSRNAMQQTPTKLEIQLPKDAITQKHEVNLKPLEVNINIQRDDDTKTTVTTNYSGAKITQSVNQSAAQGFTTTLK